MSSKRGGLSVGIAMGPVPPFAAMARRVARLRDSGFDSFWWPDHLVAFHSRELWATGGLSRIQPDPHVYADPFVCMAAAGEAAGDGLLGVCVTDPIRRTPATLLQTALSLDHLAPGRVVLGLGSGEYANYGPYGVEVASPAARLDSAAAQIRRLLDDPGPDVHGAVMGLRPAEGSRGPQLWLAAHGPKGFRTTGHYADGWIPNFLSREQWHAGREQIAAAAADAGRDPAAISYGLSVQVVIQDDHESARRLLEHPILKAFALLLPEERYEAVGAQHPLGGGGLHQMVASRAGADQLAAAESVPAEVIEGYMVHGTAEEVAEQLSGYEDLDHLILWDPVPLVDLEAAASAAAGTAKVARLLKEQR